MNQRQMIRQTLESLQIKPSKRLGQNFIVNQGIFKKIVSSAALGPEDIVLEIGPGLGGLTRACASTAHAVWAIEIDWRLFGYLKENVTLENVRFFRDDILNVDIPAFIHHFTGQFQGKKLVIMGNLPYYLSTEILMKLMRLRTLKFDMIFMLQKEFVSRLKARLGADAYGELSLLFESSCVMETAFRVNKRDFFPVPKVDSVLIRMTQKEICDSEINQTLLWQIIGTGFSQRRKMLKNALTNSNSFPYTVSNIEAALQRCSISESVRAEELTLKGFTDIVKAVTEIQNQNFHQS